MGWCGGTRLEPAGDDGRVYADELDGRGDRAARRYGRGSAGLPDSGDRIWSGVDSLLRRNAPERRMSRLAMDAIVRTAPPARVGRLKAATATFTALLELARPPARRQIRMAAFADDL